jgi:hypothetical protein
MGNNSFAPIGGPTPNCFIVQNISPEPKCLMIFNYPIPWQCSRNLMNIPGVGPDDIKASLLKGTLNRKIKAGEIVITCSDIDLLQFNATQFAFLQGAGVINGLQVGYQQINVTEQLDVQLVGNVDGTNTVFIIPSGVWIQSYPYKIIVYRNGVKQVLDTDYTISMSTPAGYDTVAFASPPDPTPPPDVITADYFISNT